MTIEIFRAVEIGSEPFRRPLNADTEILDTCEALAFFSREPVHLVTGDYGMRLRAATRGVIAIAIPEDQQVRQTVQHA